MTDYWRAGSSKPPTAWEAFEPYTARAMTSRLAQVFDKAFAGAS
jgi:hypothetical protein